MSRSGGEGRPSLRSPSPSPLRPHRPSPRPHRRLRLRQRRVRHLRRGPPPPPPPPGPPPPPPHPQNPPSPPAPPPPTPAAAPSKGDYWVQVGAFSDAKNASRLAARLTDQQYSVQQATVTRGSGGGTSGNEIFVAGAKQRDVYDKVKAKGLRVDAVKGGAVVRPALPLKDAGALSKERGGHARRPGHRAIRRRGGDAGPDAGGGAPGGVRERGARCPLDLLLGGTAPGRRGGAAGHQDW